MTQNNTNIDTIQRVTVRDKEHIPGDAEIVHVTGADEVIFVWYRVRGEQ